MHAAYIFQNIFTYLQEINVLIVSASGVGHPCQNVPSQQSAPCDRGPSVMVRHKTPSESKVAAARV